MEMNTQWDANRLDKEEGTQAAKQMDWHRTRGTGDYKYTRNKHETGATSEGKADNGCDQIISFA